LSIPDTPASTIPLLVLFFVARTRLPGMMTIRSDRQLDEPPRRVA
jgi:hypothetical protein